MRRLLCGLLVVFLLPSTAKAQETLYQLDEKKIRSVVRQVLESQSDPKAASAKRRALEEYESFILGHFRHKSALKAEAIHRLADLYMQIEMNTYQKRLDEYHDRLRMFLKGKLPSRPAYPRLDHRKSIRLYEEILKQYPEHPRNDAVLYHLAHGYADEGRLDEAIEQMLRLIKNFKESPYRSEAFFRLGEFQFELENFSQAAAYYQKALEEPDEPFTEIARYKLGWAYFLTGQYKQSIGAFIALLDAREQAASPDEKPLQLYDIPEREAELVRDVIRTLLLGFDELGGIHALIEHFRKTGHRDYESLLYDGLVDQYRTQERYTEAISALDALVRAHPLHPRAADWMLDIIEIQTQRRKPGLALKARERFVERFGIRSRWYQHQLESTRARVFQLVKQNHYDLALYHFARAQQAKKPADLQTARVWAERFLQDFPEAIEAGRIQFLLGEILYEQGLFGQAAEAYRKAAYGHPLHQNSVDAGFNELVAIEQAGEDHANRRLREAIHRFIERFPDDPRIPELLFKSATRAFRDAQYDQARQDAQELLRRFPAQAPLVHQAERLVAMSDFEQGRFDSAAQAFQRILETGRYEPSDEATLRSLLASSLYKQAEALKNEGREGKAAEMLFAIARDFPATPVAPIALLDSAALWIRLNATPDAIKALTRFTKTYPDSPDVRQALVQLAELQETRGHYAQAIAAYERLIRTASPSERGRWYFAIGTLHEKMEAWQAARDAFVRAEQGLEPHSREAFESLFRAARACDRLGLSEAATSLFSDILKRYSSVDRRDARINEVAARASFALGEQWFTAFEGVALVAPLEENLAEKRRRMDQAIDFYGRTIEFKFVELATAATYKIGLLFERFRDALLESERPKGLTPQQLDQYNILLEEQAYPFEEKAIAAYQANVRRARKELLYDEWIKKSYERLARLLPVQFARPEIGEIMTKKLSLERAGMDPP